MFTLLGRNCSRCGGCLVDEWKLDLEKEREVVCLNCGVRFWERLKKPGRPRKRTKNDDITSIAFQGYTNITGINIEHTSMNDRKKWQRSRVKRDVNDMFNDETHKQILKRQSSNRKKRKNPIKKRLPGMSSKWLEV